MPITPFHFGPGALLHAVAPRRVSFLAFCGANVLMDLEPGYYLLTGQYPLHRLMHTSLGATLAWLAAGALFIAVWRLAGRPARRLGPGAVALGAALGAYTHLLFDGIMHTDMRPFWPFSDSNPLLGLVPLGVLHLACLLAGLAGLGLIGLRRLVRAHRGP